MIDIEDLDPQDPFEIDERNRPHLAKHPPFTEEDLWEALEGDPVFFPAKPPAEWLMVSRVPGYTVVVPLLQGSSPTRLRPIGIYEASDSMKERYENE